ncbi:MAG: peptidoglycan editing factor PgeF [Eubacteriales bacterium]|nr:peptidoglycan editing factor PgeF [Eubacteriales bacterium]
MIENNFRYLTFPIFDRHKGDLIAVFSTRHGGVSTGIFESMNLGFSTGDKKENVFQNYRIFTDNVGIDFKNVVISSQYHHNNIKVVTEDDIGKGLIRDQDYEDVDGLITNRPDIALTTTHADCAPIYFYDPERKVIGLAHAGWMGTSMDICGEMVRTMHQTFGTNPQELLVAIGPSICKDCYEVDIDVKAVFDELHVGVDELVTFRQETNKYYLDITGINRKLIVDQGIKPENIYLSDYCTMTNLDLFFSHRGHKGRRGSNAAMMQLR